MATVGIYRAFDKGMVDFVGQDTTHRPLLNLQKAAANLAAATAYCCLRLYALQTMLTMHLLCNMLAQKISQSTSQQHYKSELRVSIQVARVERARVVSLVCP